MRLAMPPSRTMPSNAPPPAGALVELRDVLPTFHPAYLLRNPADKARSWDDLLLAAQVADEASQAAATAANVKLA